MAIGVPRAVLFDFGNTLFAHASLIDTIGSCAADLGHPLPRSVASALAAEIETAAHAPEELSLGRDLDASRWAERWRVLYGLADREVAGLGDAVFASMHAPSEWTAYASTADLLFWLHVAGVPVGVVSNTGWDVRRVFAQHGLLEVVDAFVLSYEVGCVKPGREIFDLACDRLGLRADEVVMVGDDPVADAGAAHAGLLTVLVPAAAPGVDNGLSAVRRVLGQ